MNEDDYDFDANENSRLSALFGRDDEASKSSLTYKAPKQPGDFSNNVRSTGSKTFHKFIRLHNNNSGSLYGKYIIAIATSEVNPSEILIYQTKKSIFIRIPVNRKILRGHSNTTLILNENNQEYKLEFGNSNDLSDFAREYRENGGEIHEEPELSCQNNQNIEIVHGEFSEVKSSEASKEPLMKTTTPGINNRNQKSKILNRLEKMGIPQLLPSQTEKDDTFIIEESNLLTKVNTDAVSSQKREDCLISDKVDHSKKNILVDPDPCIAHQQTNLLTSILVENQRNNNELKDAISELTSKLRVIIPSTELELKNEVKKLQSRIKSLEIQSENLQNELKRCQQQYYLEQNENNKSESSFQVDALENDAKNKELQFVVKQIMDIVKSLSLTSNDIKKLETVKESITNLQSTSNLECCFEFLKEKNVLDIDTGKIEVSRNEFRSELKKIMNDIFKNISEGKFTSKNLLAREFVDATAEILKNYDKSLEEIKNCDC